MSGTTDVVKGRIEEAAGALADNDKLRAKGRKDQAVGQIKQAGEKSVREAKVAARTAVDHAKDLAQQAVDEAQR